MKTESMISELKITANKHVGDTLRRFDTNITKLCEDVIPKLEKLKDYEDAEEQGLLLRLPCKVGTPVYAIEVDEESFEHFRCDVKVSEYTFDYEMVHLIGKCVFLTKEEAEQALADMKGV